MGGAVAKIVENLASKGGKDLLEAGLHAVQSGEYTLAKQGGASALLGKLLRTWQQTSDADAAKVLTPLAGDLEHVASDKVRSAEFYNHHVNNVMPSDRGTAIAGIKSQKAMLDLHTRYAQAGLKTAPLLDKGYFPEHYPREMFQKGTKEYQQAMDILTTRRKMTPAQAEHVLNIENPNPRTTSLTGKYHSIESPRRLDLPEMARQDPAVVAEHLVRGTKRFHEATVFGQKGEKAKFLLDQIQKESGIGARRYAEQIYSHFLGHAPSPEGWERAISSYEVASHLGLAVLSHPAKTIESMFVGGIKPFVQALGELASQTGRAEFHNFAQLSGAVLQDTVRDLRRMVGIEHDNLGGKVLRATQFQRVINFQEQLHVNVGKHAALDEFQQYMKNPTTNNILRLRSLGIDPVAARERGSLTQDEILKAGYRMSQMVLGGRTVMDLPPVWKTSPAGRLLTKFKPFFFLQTKFIKDQIVKPAMRGDMRPLIYASIVYPLVGEAVADLKGLARGKSLDDRPNWDKFKIDRIVDNISNVGGFGMAADVLNTMWTGGQATTLEFLTGPVYSDASEMLNFLSMKQEQKERFLLRRIPTVGPYLARHFTPPKHPYKSPLERGVITTTIDKMLK